MPSLLNDYDRRRYSRQMMIEGWGEEGQLRLKASRVFIAGAGGLGSPVSIYLAAAGVGEIHVCDADSVELSNLNRQILHSDERLGTAKAASAERTLRAINPTVQVVPHNELLDERNVSVVVGQPDIVVDCLDNFATRYLLNDFCLARRIPLVHGAIGGMLGQVTFLQPPQTPCLRCIFPEAPPAGTFPVVGVTPGVLGCIQAAEVLKYLTGLGTLLRGRLLIFEGEAMEFSTIRVDRVPTCPACGRVDPELIGL